MTADNMRVIEGGKRTRSKRKGEPPLDPVASAKAAGLRYVTGTGPGIERRKSGHGFTYLGPDGQTVRDAAVFERIEALVIPPAWSDVWICPTANGHIQAVGRDARGRKQYRYHALYRAVRDETKFTRMAAFGHTLPRIRERVQQDLALTGLPRRKVLAALVRLLDTTGIRVGNETYARENASYGLTTLRNRHVEVEGSEIRFKFRGKSAQMHEVDLRDRRLARIVKQCQDLPGFELFQYLDEEGEPAGVSSEDVNTYLQEASGEEFTAKDFRTWAGTCHMAQVLATSEVATSDTAAKKTIVAAVKSAAAKLGNRPATCRNYYVHPVVLDAYLGGTLVEAMGQDGLGKLRPDEVPAPTLGLSRAEECVLELVEQAAKNQGEGVGAAKRLFAPRRRAG